MPHAIALPPEFSDLQPFAAEWAQPSTDALHHQRQTLSMEDIGAFYDAVRPRIDAIFALLDSYDLDSMPEAPRNLLWLTFGFIEASIAVELFNAPRISRLPYPHGFTVLKEIIPTATPFTLTGDTR
ncbi:hypothetical protein [Novosphingobium sp. KN65.2]|uniref:hypothetical protein n=1 Tax=Novosphingobium sp. KN65.2 TaxID=1478134 RepID=UPI0005E94864|nr:hypothetical protein [Novosphingobium sp. KN65.2]CDO35237.1 conserved hypothetical protein [Novosphingobium sp. KN65.2]